MYLQEDFRSRRRVTASRKASREYELRAKRAEREPGKALDCNFSRHIRDGNENFEEKNNLVGVKE